MDFRQRRARHGSKRIPYQNLHNAGDSVRRGQGPSNDRYQTARHCRMSTLFRMPESLGATTLPRRSPRPRGGDKFIPSAKCHGRSGAQQGTPQPGVRFTLKYRPNRVQKAFLHSLGEESQIPTNGL